MSDNGVKWDVIKKQGVGLTDSLYQFKNPLTSKCLGATNIQQDAGVFEVDCTTGSTVWKAVKGGDAGTVALYLTGTSSETCMRRYTGQGDDCVNDVNLANYSNQVAPDEHANMFAFGDFVNGSFVALPLDLASAP